MTRRTANPSNLLGALSCGGVANAWVSFYLVADDFGQIGRAWRDYDATDLETVIQDLLSGQYNNPIRVVAFNTEERWLRTFQKMWLTNCAGGAISS